MPWEYQHKKNSQYLLPRNLYRRVLYIIKDYDRLKEEYKDTADLVIPIMDGMPHSNSISNQTEDKSIRRAMMSDEICAIEQALLEIPCEYRQGIKQNILYQTPYPEIAGFNTWKRWRQRYIWHVAKKMKFI